MIGVSRGFEHGKPLHFSTKPPKVGSNALVLEGDRSSEVLNEAERTEMQRRRAEAAERLDLLRAPKPENELQRTESSHSL